MASQSLVKPQYLRHLASWSVLAKGSPQWGHLPGSAHRQKQVNNIHNDKDKVADACVVIGIARVDERSRDNVVGKHLPVILATLLNVDDNHLLQPESPLAQEVALHDTIELAVGPVGPEVLHAHVVRRSAVNVLSKSVYGSSKCSRVKLTTPQGQKTV